MTVANPTPWCYEVAHDMGFAMIDLEEHFRHLSAAAQIWDATQFTVQDVCALTGATPKALEHFVDPKRDMVLLLGNHANPGKGKRRIFTGGQVLMIKAAYVMNAIGFPQRFSKTMAQQVERRAKALTTGLALMTQMHIITYPMSNGDWAVVPIYAESDKEPVLPLAVQVLDVDRLVTETKAQLEAIVAGETVPNFDVPDIKPEPNPYSPASNFFRAWEKDNQGRWKYVGLTWDESEEFLKLEGFRLNGDDLEVIEGVDGTNTKSPEDNARYCELSDRHEIALLKACGRDGDDEVEG